MKKIFMLMAALAVLATACTDDNFDTNDSKDDQEQTDDTTGNEDETPGEGDGTETPGEGEGDENEPVVPPVEETAPTKLFLGLAATVEELDVESKTAAQWMLAEYGEDAAYMQISALADADLSEVDVMWWHYHKDWGYGEDETFATFAADAVSEAVKQKVIAFRNAGGSLFLSRWAVEWPVELGMVGGEWARPGTRFGGTEAGENGWTTGENDMPEFFSVDEVANSPYFNGVMMDSNDNNAWKVVANKGAYYYSNQHCLYETGDSIYEWWTEQNGNVLIAHENDRKKTVMWECTYGAGEGAGKVVCFGSPLLDFYSSLEGSVWQWTEGAFHNNVYIIAKNTIDYLSGSDAE